MTIAFWLEFFVFCFFITLRVLSAIKHFKSAIQDKTWMPISRAAIGDSMIWYLLLIFCWSASVSARWPCTLFYVFPSKQLSVLLIRVGILGSLLHLWEVQQPTTLCVRMCACVGVKIQIFIYYIVIYVKLCIHESKSLSSSVHIPHCSDWISITALTWWKHPDFKRWMWVWAPEIQGLKERLIVREQINI